MNCKLVTFCSNGSSTSAAMPRAHLRLSTTASGHNSFVVQLVPQLWNVVPRSPFWPGTSHSSYKEDMDVRRRNRPVMHTDLLLCCLWRKQAQRACIKLIHTLLLSPLWRGNRTLCRTNVIYSRMSDSVTSTILCISL